MTEASKFIILKSKNSHLKMGRRKEEPARIREMILESASKLFARFGLKKTAVDEIARKARLAKGTIYNYFESKDELIRSVFRREEEKLFRRIKKMVSEESDPKRKLKKAILERLRIISESPILAQVLSEKRERLIAGLDKELERLEKIEIELIEEILREGSQQLSLAEKELRESARAIQRALKGLEVNYLEGNQEQTEKDAELLVKLLFEGLERKPSI